MPQKVGGELDYYHYLKQKPHGLTEEQFEEAVVLAHTMIFGVFYRTAWFTSETMWNEGGPQRMVERAFWWIIDKWYEGAPTLQMAADAALTEYRQDIRPLYDYAYTKNPLSLSRPYGDEDDSNEARWVAVEYDLHPEEWSLSPEQQALYDLIVGATTPREREVLTMIGSGHSIKEIQALLGLAEGTVKVTMFRGRKKARDAYTEQEDR